MVPQAGLEPALLSKQDFESSGNQILQYYNSATGADTRFGWDGDQINIEIAANAGWTTLRRYVPGPNPDETVVWYEGAGFTDRRWLHADERGSITAVTNASGATIAINTYDEYGIPAANNLGRFQYTGQAWLPEIGMYYYKARIYSPTLGRFMQPDPIGYGDGFNWYNYVGSDPVNMVDPDGEAKCKMGKSLITVALYAFCYVTSTKPPRDVPVSRTPPAQSSPVGASRIPSGRSGNGGGGGGGGGGGEVIKPKPKPKVIKK